MNHMDPTAPGQYCSVCHAKAEWAECDHCHGTGHIVSGRLTPYGESTLNMSHCPVCSGAGGYWQCTVDSKHTGIIGIMPL